MRQMTFSKSLFWNMLVGQVNDAVLTGGNTLVSCSSDTTVKVTAVHIYFMMFSFLIKMNLSIYLLCGANIRYGIACLMEYVPGRFINTLTMSLAWRQQRKM